MLFSLRGLSAGDRERIERELRKHRLAAEAALVRRWAKPPAERGPEPEPAQGKREEEIRRQAAVESARAESAARAEVEMLALQHAHERRMRQLESRGQRGSLIAVLGLIVAVLSVAGSLGLYFGKLRPETLRVQRAYDELVAAERHRAEETKRLLERSEKRRAELSSELDAARRRVEVLEGRSQ
ncbi:MAG: hypothetical protein IT377_07795 [Polyangiaceae bacterium]|nr:hypothetical protein [Myxococcales bacterium]MCC6898863.1 hypothetical protein [Polyangiaceae bacterium]